MYAVKIKLNKTVAIPKIIITADFCNEISKVLPGEMCPIPSDLFPKVFATMCQKVSLLNYS